MSGIVPNKLSTPAAPLSADNAVVGSIEESCVSTLFLFLSSMTFYQHSTATQSMHINAAYCL